MDDDEDNSLPSEWDCFEIPQSVATLPVFDIQKTSVGSTKRTYVLIFEAPSNKVNAISLDPCSPPSSVSVIHRHNNGMYWTRNLHASLHYEKQSSDIQQFKNDCTLLTIID